MPRFKNKTVLTFKETKAIRTTLYDCSLDLTIDIPREEAMDINLIYRVTLVTIAFEFVNKHKEYRHMINCIYRILKNTLSATKRDWEISDGKRLVLNRNNEKAGHFLDAPPPKNAPVVYDIIEFSGPIGQNAYGDDRPGTIDFKLKIFISPGVYAAQDVYNDHHFPIDTQRHHEDINDYITYWCCRLEDKSRIGSGFADTWDVVHDGLEERDDYFESKHAYYATTSDSSADDEEEEEEEDCNMDDNNY